MSGFTNKAFALYDAKGEVGAKIVQAHDFQSILLHGTLKKQQNILRKPLPVPKSVKI